MLQVRWMHLPKDSRHDAVHVPEITMRALQVVNLGRPVSRGERWWMHHIRNTRAYAEAALANDTTAAVAAVRELWQAVLDWQKLTGSDVAGVLMGEHTVYAKLLVDCFAQAAGSDCTSTAVDAVVRNVEAQRMFFPRESSRFADLFGRHSTLAGEYITDLAEGNRESFDHHFAEAIENGIELAAFTDQVFPQLARGLSGHRRELGQTGNYIKTEDFRAYVNQAKASLDAISDIARAYDLSEGEKQAINSELGKVSGFTIPMAEVPKCEATGQNILPLASAALVGLLVGSVV